MAGLSSSKTKETAPHGFHDEVDSFVPPYSPPRTNTIDSGISVASLPPFHKDECRQRHSESDDTPHSPTSAAIKRQDSGYGSHNTTPRTSLSYSRPIITTRRAPALNSSTTTLPIHNPTSRPRTRPGLQRSSTTTSAALPVYLVRPGSHQPSIANTYTSTATSNPKHASSTALLPPESLSEPNLPDYARAVMPFRPLSGSRQHFPPSPTPPPQTTHYWTSDRTRRLEYAAIDAASRGVRGWARRHLVPACIAPKEDEHLAFDDHTGSVRRYRLDLEEDEGIPGYRKCSRKGESGGNSLVPAKTTERRKPWTSWL